MNHRDEDAYDLDALHRSLSGTPFAEKVNFFPSIASTNSFAMQQADAGAAANTVYLAEEQTSGRGRGNHAWHSARNAGLYVSVLLRPTIAPADILWISLAAGLAVRQAVFSLTSLHPDIRWPNDILIGTKKFGGILTELNAEATKVRHCVIGMGINVNQENFPPDVAAIATSLRMETGHLWPRQDLLTALLQSLHREVLALDSDLRSAADSIVSRLTSLSSWVRGKRVHVDEAGGYFGTTAGLDARGFLQVRTSDGLRTVLSGGVREGR